MSLKISKSSDPTVVASYEREALRLLQDAQVMREYAEDARGALVSSQRDLNRMIEARQVMIEWNVKFDVQDMTDRIEQLAKYRDMDQANIGEYDERARVAIEAALSHPIILPNEETE